MKWPLILLFIFSSLQAKLLDINIGAEGVILMNAKTGVILYEKNAYAPTFPASTTKIATALYALDQMGDQLDVKMKAGRECIASISPQAKKQSNYRSPSYWLETDGSHIGIKLGEEFPFYDLLCALMIASANDAANVIALNIGQTIPSFMEGLNGYIKELGCRGTYYTNPHGLHHPDHMTTPYDLALMAKIGLQNSVFKQIVSTARYACPQTNLEYERIFLQSNRLLRQGSFFYPKAIGIKTGTTQAAGKNLVAAAEEGGRTLIAVALGHRGARSQLFIDIKNIFEKAFNEPKMRRYLLKEGATNLFLSVKGARKKLKTMLKEGLFYDFYPAEESAVKAHVKWQVPPLPIAALDQVGVIEICDERGVVIQTTPLLALEGLKPTLWHQMTHFFSKNKRGRKVIFLGSSVALVLFLFARRKRRSVSSRPLF